MRYTIEVTILRDGGGEEWFEGWSRPTNFHPPEKVMVERTSSDKITIATDSRDAYRYLRGFLDASPIC